MDLRIFIVEPESIRRRLIGDAAEQSPELVVLGAAGSLIDGCGAIEASPDIFLVNASLLQTERDCLRRAAAAYDGAYFVLFSTHPDIEALLNASELPVRGFLSFNHLATEEFARSLHVIAYGGAVIEPISAQLLLEHLGSISKQPQTAATAAGNTFDLTSREREVLEMVRRGLSNKEIARRMEISLGTVRAHLRSVFRKLDVTSRAGAVASYLSSPFEQKQRLAG